MSERQRATNGTSVVAMSRLLVLTDRSQLPLGRSLVSVLAECREAGLTHVILRELDEPADRRAALAQAVADLGLVVISAHQPLPAAVGVHLPSTGDGPVSGLRGRSCHSRADVARAAADGFDYATLSPYAPTPSKPGYGPSLEAGALAGHEIPVYALGGITLDNVARAVAEGAYGVAVMGEVMRARHPGAVVEGLLRAVSTDIPGSEGLKTHPVTAPDGHASVSPPAGPRSSPDGNPSGRSSATGQPVGDPRMS